MFASQTANAFYARLGEDSAKAFMANFVSWSVMNSAPASHAWANDRLKKQRVFDYSYYLTGQYQRILSNDFQRAHMQALSDRRNGKPEMNPGQRLDMLKRLRYDLTRPTDVTLTKHDRKALNDTNDRTGRMPRSLAKLAWMFTGGAVTTNVWEAVRGTASLAAGLAVRTSQFLTQTFMGGAVRHDDYTAPPFQIENKDKDGRPGKSIDLFHEDDWHLLNHPHVGMISVKRGGVPRRDLCDTIGKLSIAQIREFARLQGIQTVYDEIDRRAKIAANDATKAAA